MKKTLFVLIGFILLSSCSNDETLEKITPPPPITQTPIITAPSKIEARTNGDTTYITNIIPIEYKLYKESIKNQRSGIFFQWSDNPNEWSLKYFPKTDANSKSWYGGGQAYGDVNIDGYMDYLVSVNNDENNVELKWFINTGNNYNFTVRTSMFNQSTKGMSAHKILKTDVNNDGIADYIALGVDERIPGDYSGNFSVLIGKSNGTFDVNNIPNPNKYWFHNGAAGDLNGDGFVDVITATFIWLGDGKGNFVKNYEMDSYSNSILTYEISDMNNDGLNDIILASAGNLNKTTIIFNNNNKFDSTNKISKLDTPEYLGTMDVELYDIDSDSDLDIIELRVNGGAPDSDPWNPIYNKTKLFVYLNNGSSFQYVPNYIPNSEDGGWLHGDSSVRDGEQDKNGWSRFKFDDIDGDGVDDIIPENYHNGKYNGLKKINGVWKQHIFSFQKCKK
jgi:hypothetical protein